MRIKDKNKIARLRFVYSLIFGGGSIMELWNGEKLYMDHKFISRRHQMAICLAKCIIKFQVSAWLNVLFIFTLHFTPYGRYKGLLCFGAVTDYISLSPYQQRLEREHIVTQHSNCKSFSNHRDDIYCWI